MAHQETGAQAPSILHSSICSFLLLLNTKLVTCEALEDSSFCVMCRRLFFSTPLLTSSSSGRLDRTQDCSVVFPRPGSAALSFLPLALFHLLSASVLERRSNLSLRFPSLVPHSRRLALLFIYSSI